MAGRAAALAEQFERAVAEFDLALAGLSDAQWRLACPDEGRAVGVLARHVAEGIPFQMAVFREIAAGRQPTTVSMTDLATMNAGHAAEWADCAKGETLALLRDNAAAAVAEVRGWDDTQLALAGKYIADLPEPWPVERWVDRILVGHVQGHLQSIRAALGSA